MKTKLIKEQNHFQIICEKKSIKEITNEAWDVTGIEIEWFASTKDKDRMRDIVEPKAFKEAIDLYMMNPVMLLQHKADKPVGTVTEATIKPKGLYIKATITEDIDWVMSALKNWVIRAFSIWYRVKDYEVLEVKDADDYITWYETIIKDLELYEISLVSIPANPYALMKSMDSCIEVDVEKSMEQEQKEIEDKIWTKEVEEETTEVVEEETADEVVEEEVEDNIDEEEEVVADESEDKWEPEETEEKEEEKEVKEVIEEKSEVMGTEDEKVEEKEEWENTTDWDVEDVEEKWLSSEDSIENKLTEQLEIEKWMSEDSDERIYVCAMFEKEFVYNHCKWGGTDAFDKYYRRWYESWDDWVSLSWENVEVESTSERVDKAIELWKQIEEIEVKEEEIKEEVKIKVKVEAVKEEVIEETEEEATEEDVVEEKSGRDWTGPAWWWANTWWGRWPCKEIETIENKEEVVEESQEAENSDEIAEDKVETDPVEKGIKLADSVVKSLEELVKTNHSDVLEQVKGLIWAKDKTIADLTKRLDSSIDAMKSLVEYLETLDKKLDNTILKTGVAFERAAPKRKSWYGLIAENIKKIL